MCRAGKLAERGARATARAPRIRRATSSVRGGDGYNRSRNHGNTAMAANRLIEKQRLFDGKKIKLEVHHLEDEETGKRHTREVVVHPGAVVILPILPNGDIMLIRTRRYAVGQVLLELP